MSTRPVILVTADRTAPTPGQPVVPNEHGRIRPPRAKAWVKEWYVTAVSDAGGMPLLVPALPRHIEQWLELADGIVLTGGDMDIHPRHYGQVVRGRLDRVEPARTEVELGLARGALQASVPVLGVCGGMQVLAVAAAGTLVQDLPLPDEQHPHRLRHEQLTDPTTPSHPVTLTGVAVDWLGEVAQVNSTHHQAVDDPGAFDVVGRAPDGVIEVIHHPGHPFAAGIQWHPEALGQLGPYRALVRAAAERRRRRG